MNIITKSAQALLFAASQHESVNHLYDDKPYYHHLLEVTLLAHYYSDCLPSDFHETALVAAPLHDLIEDTRMTYNDVKKVFGSEVAEVVYLCTQERGRNRNERQSEKYYNEISQNEIAVFVKLCDRLANMNYSKDSGFGGSMYKKYRDELPHFLKGVLPKYPVVQLHFEPLVNQLESHL